MPEPIRRTPLPHMTPEELARLQAEQKRLGQALASEDELRVLLIEVARQIARQRRLLTASGVDHLFEVVRVSIKLVNGDVLNYAVHPGWVPAEPQPKQAEPGEAGTEEKEAGGRSAGGKK